MQNLEQTLILWSGTPRHQSNSSNAMAPAASTFQRVTSDRNRTRFKILLSGQENGSREGGGRLLHYGYR